MKVKENREQQTNLTINTELKSTAKWQIDRFETTSFCTNKFQQVFVPLFRSHGIVNKDCCTLSEFLLQCVREKKRMDRREAKTSVIALYNVVKR
jgi:hypothetical protein